MNRCRTSPKPRTRTSTFSRTMRLSSFLPDAAADKFLLEAVEREPLNIAGQWQDHLDALRKEHEYSDEEHATLSEIQMEKWWDDLRELVRFGLVQEVDGGHRLTHHGRVQLHSLRSADRNEQNLALAIRNLALGTAKLKVAVRTLVASVLLHALGITLSLFLHCSD